MTTEREEIELHPAVGELIVKMRADLATAIARADAAEFALQCEATRHEETRAAVREYLAAIDEERALDVAAVTMPARWPDAYARAVDQRDAAHARVQVTEATLRRIAEPISEDGR